MTKVYRRTKKKRGERERGEGERERERNGERERGEKKPIKELNLFRVEEELPATLVHSPKSSKCSQIPQLDAQYPKNTKSRKHGDAELRCDGQT